jgi:ABC-type nitrate/sulfonate/bicarbonate transport system substrate-binding protein
MKGYTFPALACTEKTIRERPDVARAAINAVKQAQQALRADPGKATAIGRKLFPPQEASLIAELIRRDASFYEPDISPQAVKSMNQFARELGLLSHDVNYGGVVWNG